jgi:protein-tyrosine phosphatase
MASYTANVPAAAVSYGVLVTRAAAEPIRLLFVCMGNICRSPTAEAVMRRLVREEGLEGAVEIDSAGVGDWHAGQPPDMRAAAAASARGLTLEGAARAIAPRDFADYDLILAADRRNLRDLRAVAPRDARARMHLLREFDPASEGAPDLDVPDPYYGGDDGFERVLDLVEAACRGLLDELRASGRV